MARDPRFNVKPCPPIYGDKFAAETANSTGSRRNFFGGLGKVGDVEVLNDIGASGIGTGLRTLASVSNSIRTGCGALPTSIGGILGAGLGAADAAATKGTNWVLETVGLNTNVVDAVRAFNPQIANQATGQARQIFEKVQEGSFTIRDIPFVLQDLQNLERLGRSIFTPSTWFERNKFQAVCEASPYAIDLINRHPKFNFLFVVEFTFEDQFATLKNLQFPFMVKKSTRPGIRYNMEDVNYYNYRTKIITRTMFDEMDISFYDDNQNDVMDFIVAYLRATVPITNKNSGATGDAFSSVLFSNDGMFPGAGISLDGFSQTQNFYSPNSTVTTPTNSTNPFIAGGVVNVVERDKSGKNFSIPTYNYSASVGPLGLVENSPLSIIKYINLYHIYDWGRKINTYSFIKPKLTSFNMSDLNMEDGNGVSEISIKFEYDTVIIDTNVNFSSQSPTSLPTVASKIASLQEGAIYKLRSVNSAADNANPPQAPNNVAPPPQPGECGPANTQTGNQPTQGIGGFAGTILNNVGSTTFGG